MEMASNGLVTCREADLSLKADADLLVTLLNAYATDAMGGGEPLSDFVKENLARELHNRPTAHAFFGYIDEVPAGLSICFEGFSTFECKPLINIHDFVVLPAFRRRGVCTSLLFYIEQYALSRGCCKITMEVLQGNHAAQAAYRGAGFEGYQLDPAVGCAVFWQKTLS
jgi:ribosomal protein S18 acetylase RimI-like enzyme